MFKKQDIRSANLSNSLSTGPTLHINCISVYVEFKGWPSTLEASIQPMADSSLSKLLLEMWCSMSPYQSSSRLIQFEHYKILNGYQWMKL